MLFTSTTPAWSNQNLYRLAEKTVSPNIFIRAATPGILVSDVNCHPFQFGKFFWMYNGHIAGFQYIKRRIRSSFSDDIYHFIQGTTDSEYAFALFLDQLNGLSGDISYKIIQKAMKGTIKQLNEWSKEVNVSDPSFYNFAMTDGQTIIVTRYVKDPARQPASLYISRGERYECR